VSAFEGRNFGVVRAPLSNSLGTIGSGFMRDRIDKKHTGIAATRSAFLGSRGFALSNSQTSERRASSHETEPAPNPDNRFEQVKRYGHSLSRRVSCQHSNRAHSSSPIQTKARDSLEIHRESPAGGCPLPDTLRPQMEKFFGHDFSAVRVREGPSADRLGASAFARGDHIHFGPGSYSPKTDEGRKLIGHELAHVVQQRSGRVRAPSNRTPPVNADPTLESEAVRLGEEAARGVRIDMRSSAVAKTEHGPPSERVETSQGETPSRTRPIQVQPSGPQVVQLGGKKKGSKARRAKPELTKTAGKAKRKAKPKSKRKQAGKERKPNEEAKLAHSKASKEEMRKARTARTHPRMQKLFDRAASVERETSSGKRRRGNRMAQVQEKITGPALKAVAEAKKKPNVPKRSVAVKATLGGRHLKFNPVNAKNVKGANDVLAQTHVSLRGVGRRSSYAALANPDDDQTGGQVHALQQGPLDPSLRTLNDIEMARVGGSFIPSMMATRKGLKAETFGIKDAVDATKFGVQELVGVSGKDREKFKPLVARNTEKVIRKVALKSRSIRALQSYLDLSDDSTSGERETVREEIRKGMDKIQGLPVTKPGAKKRGKPKKKANTTVRSRKNSRIGRGRSQRKPSGSPRPRAPKRKSQGKKRGRRNGK